MGLEGWKVSFMRVQRSFNMLPLALFEHPHQLPDTNL